MRLTSSPNLKVKFIIEVHNFLPDAVRLGGAYDGYELLSEVYKITCFVAVGGRLSEAAAAKTIHGEGRNRSLLAPV